MARPTKFDPATADIILKAVADDDPLRALLAHLTDDQKKLRAALLLNDTTKPA